jgi:hypothetical protein
MIRATANLSYHPGRRILCSHTLKNLHCTHACSISSRSSRITRSSSSSSIVNSSSEATASAMSSAEEEDSNGKLTVLCLHGFLQTATVSSCVAWQKQLLCLIHPVSQFLLLPGFSSQSSRPCSQCTRHGLQLEVLQRQMHTYRAGSAAPCSDLSCPPAPCCPLQVFRSRVGSMRKGLKSRVHFEFQDAPFHVSNSPTATTSAQPASMILPF